MIVHQIPILILRGEKWLFEQKTHFVMAIMHKTNGNRLNGNNIDNDMLVR